MSHRTEALPAPTTLTQADEALRRARNLDATLTLAVPRDGSASLHVWLYEPGKRRPEVDLFASDLAALAPEDLVGGEAAEVLGAVEAVLPQLQVFRDRLAAEARE